MIEARGPQSDQTSATGGYNSQGLTVQAVIDERANTRITGGQIRGLLRQACFKKSDFVLKLRVFFLKNISLKSMSIKESNFHSGLRFQYF
jgi:hypothetical protein